MSIIAVIKTLAKRPKQGFIQLMQSPVSAWYPFLLLTLSLILFNLTYYALVDQSWLLTHTLDILSGHLSPSEQAQMSRLLPSAETLKYNAIIGGFVVLLVQGAILAALMNLLTKLDPNNTDGFTDWLGQVWWTQLPMIPQLALALLVMLMSASDQIEQTSLLITSANQLMGLTPKQPMFGFFASLDIFSLWSTVLLFYLVAARTQLSTQLCMSLAVLPLIIEFCIHYISG